MVKEIVIHYKVYLVPNNIVLLLRLFFASLRIIESQNDLELVYISFRIRLVFYEDHLPFEPVLNKSFLYALTNVTV